MKKYLLVDDHEVVRDGIKRILGEQPEAIRFGEASSTSEASSLVAQEEWDLVVLDLSLGGRSGLELIKQFKQLRPHLPILVLSMHSEEQYARRSFRAGAAGYITKDSPRVELVRAVNKVVKGGRYVSAGLAEILITDLERGSDGPLHEALSDREFEVMCLIASGKTVGEIASLLSLSDKTISTYRARILEKTGMRNNAELTHYTLEHKLIGRQWG
jgi:two-component system invasion response regulator UvrY